MSLTDVSKLNLGSPVMMATFGQTKTGKIEQNVNFIPKVRQKWAKIGTKWNFIHPFLEKSDLN